MLLFYYKRYILLMCEKNNIKCILNVIIEIISLKVINLIKLIKIGFDVNYYKFNIIFIKVCF